MKSHINKVLKFDFRDENKLNQSIPVGRIKNSAGSTSNSSLGTGERPVQGTVIPASKRDHPANYKHSTWILYAIRSTMRKTQGAEGAEQYMKFGELSELQHAAAQIM